jgi:lactobin A/cerein 7B family class IIb bacteriocin
MSETNYEKTPAAVAQSTRPAELNERELSQVSGGLLPAVGPASAAKTPIVVVESALIGLL